ncbi:MAG: response regulator transcription factor [Raineya sp.]|nr:response regulator transcription factor [Raineya sp.]MDW8295372.1 response regulator transcription factor [Raineya sp.]
MEKILIVEDDFSLAESLKKQLSAEGYLVENVYDGLLAEKLALRQHFDCIILDINLPSKNGYEVCKSLRNHHISTPILMLTAFGELEDKLEGFESGVDDYLPKPFFIKELLARLKALLKRNYQRNEPNSEILVIEDLQIDVGKKSVQRGNETIKLTAREFQILSILAEARGNPISKKELIQKVWGTNTEVNTNTIEVFINSLRNKIDKNFPTKLIHTKLGFGYYVGKNE